MVSPDYLWFIDGKTHLDGAVDLSTGKRTIFKYCLTKNIDIEKDTFTKSTYMYK